MAQRYLHLVLSDQPQGNYPTICSKVTFQVHVIVLKGQIPELPPTHFQLATFSDLCPISGGNQWQGQSRVVPSVSYTVGALAGIVDREG